MAFNVPETGLTTVPKRPCPKPLKNPSTPLFLD